jgi:UDP-3-O-[3-hydroxymyristoyl] N-acetylglucosamine deacetylase/3-hydroxyacyl-[acyl-carrier-protein] dehydratase
MYQKQHTLAQSVHLEGIGIHTGISVSVTIHPAEENYGYRFIRTDLPEQPVIHAVLDNVSDSQRSTTLSENNAKVQTVEHLLSALSGLQIDNAKIEITGGEVPILDGSARIFLEAFKKAGIVEQKANREFYVIEEPIHYQDPARNIDLAALAYDGFRATVMIDYNSKILGIQHATLVKIEDFETQIAPCRTFCLWHEIEPMVKNGLIKGGSLENAVVIVDDPIPDSELEAMAKLLNKPKMESVKPGVLNNEPLHFSNEPARHKLLDLIGDLALIGSPLKAQIVAVRPGHAPNVAFAKKIHSFIKQKKLVRRFQKKDAKNYIFDVNAIADILPHRYPFLLVDRVTDFSEKSIEGIKNVTINEPFFNGHFPNNPIMPGVLMLEAMAQVGGILLLNIIDDPKNYWVYLLGIDAVRFKKPVTPGDQVVFKLDLVNLRSGICKLNGKAFVDDQLVCQAEITASLVKKNK